MWFIKARCDAAIEEYVFIDYKGSIVMLAKTSGAFNVHNLMGRHQL
jgi:hypothetical protein